MMQLNKNKKLHKGQGQKLKTKRIKKKSEDKTN
jgi:hypothetical protein